ALRSHQRPVSTGHLRGQRGIDTHVVVARHECAASLGHNVVLTVLSRTVPRTAEREPQTGRPDRAGWTLRAGAPVLALVALVASLTSRASVALLAYGTLRAHFAFRSSRALRSDRADCSLRTDRTDRSLRTDRSSRAL